MTIDGKKLINPIIYFFGGLFGFIFLAINQISAFVKYNGETESEAVANAYKFFELDFGETDGIKGAFLMVFVVLCVVAIIITCIAMMGVGVVRLLQEIGIEIPGSSVFSVIGKIASIVNMVASSCSFLFLLIFCLANTRTESSWGIEYSAGLYPGAGAYLLMIFSVAVFVVPIIMDSLCKDNDQPKTAYVCTACGKNCKAGSKFCDACGAPVEAQVQYPTVYVCSGCGKKAKASEKFCSACGGAIVQQVVYPTVRTCSVCGQKAGKNDKFCVSCGGAVVEQVLAPQNQDAEA
jgi:rRNA maturation endonuclease Nob1